MSALFKELEERVAALEANHSDIQELIGLLQDVKGAMRVFARIGNGVKWLAIIITSLIGAYTALRKWFI